MDRPPTATPHALIGLVCTGLVACSAGNGPVDAVDSPTDVTIRTCEAIPIVPASGEDDAMAWRALVPTIGGHGKYSVREWTADGRLLSETAHATRIETTYVPGSWKIDQRSFIVSNQAGGSETQEETWSWWGNVATITRTDGSVELQDHRPDGLPVRRWRVEEDGSETDLKRWSYLDDLSWQLARVWDAEDGDEVWDWSCAEGEGLDGLDQLVAEVSGPDGERVERFNQDGRVLSTESESGDVASTRYHSEDASLPTWGVAERTRLAGPLREDAVSTWVSAGQPLERPGLELPDPVSTSCEPIPPDPGPFASDAPAWSAVEGGPFANTHVWTADGRLLQKTDNGSLPPGHTELEYQPGSWRIAAALRLGDLSPYEWSEYTWDGNVGVEVNPNSGTWEYIHRDDGLLLRAAILDDDGTPFVVEEYTYLGPDTWQIATRGGSAVTWDCLTVTGSRPASYHPDGRIGWELTGDGEGLIRYTYVDDTWRTDQKIVEYDVGLTVTATWTWTPL